MASSSLPGNATDRTRVLVRLAGESGIRNEPVSGGLASLRVESAVPIRRFYSWKGKRNHEGLWWSSTTRVHVGFESLLERDFLMDADYDAGIVGICSQPLALLWPRGAVGQRSHVPDFFCRLANGDGRLVDVRDPERVAKSGRQFAATREACEQAGWQYEVFTGLAPVRWQTLRWISGYRQDRFAPDAAAEAGILAAFASPASLRAGVRVAAKATGRPRELVLANVYHLLWHRLLRIDAGSPLTMDSQVRA